MPEVHHYDLERILEDLQIEASESDPEGKKIIERALEAEGEVLDALEDESITPPTTYDSRLANIVNIRTRGKHIQITDRDGGQKLIDYSDKLLAKWIGKKKKSHQQFYPTSGGNEGTQTGTASS